MKRRDVQDDFVDDMASAADRLAPVLGLDDDAPEAVPTTITSAIGRLVGEWAYADGVLQDQIGESQHGDFFRVWRRNGGRSIAINRKTGTVWKLLPGHSGKSAADWAKIANVQMLTGSELVVLLRDDES
jgi:hypothetical protein